MRVLILVFVCLGICINGAEAQLKSLTIDDTNDSKLRPKQPGEYGWIPKKDAYFYFEKDKMAWQIVDLPSKKEHLLFVDSMIKDLKRGRLDTFSSTPSLTWISLDTVQFKVNNKLYSYNINKRSIQEVNQWEPEAENMEFSKMNDLAYTKSGNIYLKLRDSKTAQVLTDGDGYQVVFGEAVHRNEFGINKGLFWNDNGDKLAFYRMDQSQVADYP
ncbi:MAG: DPP IV N-terminal domain-containing protein [Saprospiraceae bacterium]|nr:DPP IV N-terminal domain-containing protein [Saprospiraceae bacterium]